MPLHPLGTDFLMIDGKDLDSPMDVKLRRNGAQTKGPYAVPNPYATSKINLCQYFYEDWTIFTVSILKLHILLFRQ